MDDRLDVQVPVFSKQLEGQASDPTEEVYSFLWETWDSWWKPRSVYNVCMIHLETEQKPLQFLYCSTSHKYTDGGAAAAFVHALREAYDALKSQAEVDHSEHPVLEVHQQRLKRFIEGKPCPEGQVDVYLFDINNDSYQHGFGQSVGAMLDEQVCEVMRVAGLRMSCSEEIAWLACMTCAMCRLMPDEKLIKILMVHNGRLGDAEGAIACTSQYVMLTIPCAGERSGTPLADVASRVKYAVTNGKFRRPSVCEQAHARINIGGMVGADGSFSQMFKAHRCRKSSWSRASYVIQLRMDNEGGIWCVKDFKCHQMLDAEDFWRATVCAGLEIAEGWFTSPLGYAT